MRKIKYLVGALFVGTIAVNANPVAVNTAQKVAINFYNQTYHTNITNEVLAYTERSSDGDAVYYAFNIDNNKGFVIVSAEDATIPVIGYSNEGPFVIPVAGNNVDFWMTNRKNEIIAIRTQHVRATDDITTTWGAYVNNTPERLPKSDMASVSQLCFTTWDQSPYYNQMCPYQASIGRAVTGCVATAMAQIMRYWCYPSIGTGTWCYDDVVAEGYQENYGELCATFDTSHYSWPNMPLSVTSANTQVAKLMYDCGVSVDMDYSPSGSGALVTGGNPSAEYSYYTYFGYEHSTIKGLNYTDYTEGAWEALLKDEINASRPVQYMGTDPTQGGHSWVCDGYSGSNFHMNWGWSGMEDGYFSVGALNPSPYDFSEQLGAIMGIEPPPGLAVPKVSNNASINVYPNPSQGEFTFAIPANLNNSQLRISNSIGQEVNTANVREGNYQINLGNQPAGTYLYRLINETGTPVSSGKLSLQ